MVSDLSDYPSIERILAQAKERETVYDWLGAAESLKEAFGILSEKDLSMMGIVYEQLGYTFYRSSMQGRNNDEFAESLHRAVENYEKAREYFGRVKEPAGNDARVLRCNAMIAFLGYWLAPKPPDKKRMADESWRLTKEALNAFRERGDPVEYAKTFDQLSIGACFAWALEWNFEAGEKTVREAVEHGEQAISLLANVPEYGALARAYARTGFYRETYRNYYVDANDERRLDQKHLSYWNKAVQLSEDAALLELPLSVHTWGNIIWRSGTEDVLAAFDKALQLARKTGDRFLVGSALDGLVYHLAWKELATEDPDESLKLYRKCLDYSEEARSHYSTLFFTTSRAATLWVEAPDPEYYWALSTEEPDLAKRHDLLRKAVEATPDLLKRAEESGCPEVVGYAQAIASKAFGGLAKTESKVEEKRKLLEKAHFHRNEAIKMDEQFERFGFYNQGVNLSYLADIKSELADLAIDHDARRVMLQASAKDKETALALVVKDVPILEREGSVTEFAWLGEKQVSYGDLLIRLYDHTGDKQHLKRAVEAFGNAIDSLQRLDLVSRIAECFWKAGKAHDYLGEHLNAAENFLRASKNYDRAAGRIPQLREFYRDYSLYMKAWTELERARYHHGRQEYAMARESYERAASLHKSTRVWSFLASNYAALAQVENGEDLSRKEQSEEAMEAFQQAARVFNESKSVLNQEFGNSENLDMKQMIASLVKGSDQRREYCMGRIALEEAKLVDRKGDHSSSSERYGRAAEIFERIIQTSDSEQDRKELRLIATLSKAWQMMARAEDETSPELYLEASRLFEAARELSPNEKARSLALGHSRFCKALDAGTRFADTREATLHGTAIHHLESAANFYLKAGFQNASEYAEASKLLFDAYAYMDEANKEKDHEKKTKVYLMAEKVLKASADTYLKAEQPGRREQVMRMLEKVKRERELEVSLTEVLHAPSIFSTTTAFAAPMPTRESAVGLERFEHADVQASVITRQKQLKVGEDLDLEIELVNAGKGPAQLVKVEELIPEGFELTEKPEQYRVEDSYLNMKGRRLDPLKTVEVKMVLRPKVQGQFMLKPRILYLDESGRYKSQEPGPVEVTVKELGISGWLKGR